MPNQLLSGVGTEPDSHSSRRSPAGERWAPAAGAEVVDTGDKVNPVPVRLQNRLTPPLHV
jgi:hypothetical protein